MTGSTGPLVAELHLLTTILERLLESAPNGNVRKDQLEPLASRLRSAVGSLQTAASVAPAPPTETERPAGPKALHSFAPSRPTADDLHPHAAGKPTRSNFSAKKNHGAIARSSEAEQATAARRSAATRPSSLRVVPIPRLAPPSDRLLVSKEVIRVFTCTLYNALEAVAAVTEAASASILVKVGDEMVSVANVASKLTFPPKLNRRRCQESMDAEVLGSGVAINQRIDDPTSATHSVLIFPVYARGAIRSGRHRAMATLRLENKASGKKFFDAFDESLAFFASGLIGEIMTRVEIDWLENFFDPATQHIVAPFEPVRVTGLPFLRGPSAPRAGREELTTAKRADLASKIDSFAEEVLIERVTDPHLVEKATVTGLSVMPSLREVRNYVENVQDCWARNVTSNVNLMEDERDGQIELLALRRQLTQTHDSLTDRDERLRLYQLEGSDYKQEYRGIKKELDAYIQRRDKSIM